MRRGFTLIELLVVIGVIAVLLGMVLSALVGARGAVRTTVSLNNLRQIAMVSREYGAEHRDRSPALGQPWTMTPFWALEVEWRVREENVGAVYSTKGILRDPHCEARYGREMERCYAVNGTGRSGMPGDSENYDTSVVHIRLDRVRDTRVPWYLTSAIATATTNGPPPTRTAGALDLRNPVHLAQRLGRFAGRERFVYVAFDGSSSTEKVVPPRWVEAPP
jgi:prepilin-type N-terminal cleavage/methylation domain-containing protein